MKPLLSLLVAAAAVLTIALQGAASDDATTSAVSLRDPAFRVDAPGPAKPYTHLKFRNRAQDFQFAIMSDRNGANRKGVFEDAIRKLNWLQPEFVISIGDLIGGYTTDTQKVTAMWDELDGLVNQLEMPYFYVAGNHDLSNPRMAKIWEERRGRRYYHFLYHDVLFLVVNTDDPFPVQMSDEQVAYFEKVLRDNPNPRWTMVFMHNPSWRLDPTKDQAKSAFKHDNRFSRFDEMLKGRRYTVFAGHTHDYAYTKRNGGAEHIVLATTGGGSDLRGARVYGEFDGVVWVTMTDSGPRIVNLALDGILPPDVRTVATAQLVGKVTKAAPAGTLIRVDGDVFTSGTARLRLSNPAESQTNVRIELSAPPPLTVEPELIDRDMAAGSTETVAVTVSVLPDTPSGGTRVPPVNDGAPASSPHGVRIDDIAAPISAKYTITLDDETATEPLEVTGDFTITVDGVRPIRRAPAPVTVDGNLEEWGRLPLSVEKPEPPTAKWRSPADASYRMGVSRDDGFLYLAIQTRDNKAFLDGALPPHQQDSVEFRIDARPDPERSRGRALWNYTDHGMVSVAPPAAPDGEMAVYIRPATLAGVARVKAVRNAKGIAAEVAVPAAWLDEQQGTSWTAVRINACMHDADSKTPRKHKQLWWRPDWRFPRNVEGSGTFLKE
jgi:hypothetical protein